MAGLSPEPGDRGELLSAYLDGELHTGELDEVSGFLTGDEETIADFRGLQETRYMLRQLPEHDIPVWLLHHGHSADRLSAYLDGELNSEEARDVVAHVIACRECRADLQEFDRARTAIRALPGVDAPDGLLPEPPARRAGRRRRVGAAVALAAGAAAVLAIVFSLSADAESGPELTIDDLGGYHVARASAEPAFSIIPTVLEGEGP
jgi:anti-sigma factor RsiW